MMNQHPSTSKAAAALVVACCAFLVVCTLEQSTESALEGYVVPTAASGDLDQQDLISLLEGNQVVSQGTYKLAQVLAAQDSNYQAKLKRLLVSEKVSHERYFAEMAAMQVQVERARAICQREAAHEGHITMCIEKQRQLVKEAKHRLRISSNWYNSYATLIRKSLWMRRFQISRKNAVRGTSLMGLSIMNGLSLSGGLSLGVAPEVQACMDKVVSGDEKLADSLRQRDADFLSKYDALKKGMKVEKDQFTETKTLLEAKDAGAQATCEKDAKVVSKKEDLETCKEKLHADVVEAQKLLEAQSPWFKAYSKIIKTSKWYKTYEITTQAKMTACHATELRKIQATVTVANTTAPTSVPTAAPTEVVRTNSSIPKSSETKKKVEGMLKDAKRAIDEAKNEKEENEAKEAVKTAVENSKDSGAPDGDAVSRIAWTRHQLDKAMKWAEATLRRHSLATDLVAAWKAGEVETGLKMRALVEKASGLMFAVVDATKAQVETEQEREDRDQEQIKQLDRPIKLAKEAAADAEQSVVHAQEALDRTSGNEARRLAKQELKNAKDAVHDANEILKSEVEKKDAILETKMKIDDSKLVAETELHYEAQKAYKRAQVVQETVLKALALARKSKQAHHDALIKQVKAEAMEKAAKKVKKELNEKARLKDKAEGLEKGEAYAAKLADEALAAGIKARDLMTKAAKSGRLAAKAMMELAEIKANLYKLQHPPPTNSSSVEPAAAFRESAAAVLAMEASEGLDQALKERVEHGSHLMEASIHLDVISKADREANMDSGEVVPSDVDIQKWSSEGDMWKEYYKKLYHDKYVAAVKKEAEAGQAVETELEKENSQSTKDDDFKKRVSILFMP